VESQQIPVLYWTLSGGSQEGDGKRVTQLEDSSILVQI